MSGVPTEEKRKRLSDFTREEREAMTDEEFESYLQPEFAERKSGMQDIKTCRVANLDI